jgi:TetR/AcrR family transcriptional regulator, repressor of fatR-cypB operon
MNETGIPRKERERQQRRTEILAAAREVFATRGFAEATLDEIADTAEFGKGTIYNYFANKDDLFRAVIDDSFEALHALLVRNGRPSDRAFREVMLEMTGKLLELLYDNIPLVHLILRELHRSAQHDAVMKRFLQLLSVVEPVLVDALARGEIRRCNTRLAAFQYVASVFFLFERSVCSEGDTLHITPVPATPTAEQRAGAVRDILDVLDVTFFHGLLTDTQRALS